MGLTKDRLIFDPADAAESDNIGSYLRAGSDGDLLSSTNIGGKEALDVNIVGGADSGIFAEDSTHGSGANGQFILAVRNDAESSLVGADGDYAPLQVSATGRLKVDADITSGAEYAEDDAHSSTDIGNFILGVRQDTLSSSVDTDGDYGALKLNARGGLWTVPVGTVADDAADAENPIKVGFRATNAALSAASAANDRVDGISDLYRRLFVNTSPNIGLNSQSLTVDSTEVAFPTPLAGRRIVYVQNTSSSDVYIGPTGVTTSSGLRVAKGATVDFECGPNVALFAIAGSDTNAVRIFELA